MGPPTTRNIEQELRYQLLDAAIAMTTLPLFVTLPVGYLLLAHSRPRESRITRWVLLALTIAVIDLAAWGICFWLVFVRAVAMY